MRWYMAFYSVQRTNVALSYDSRTSSCESTGMCCSRDTDIRLNSPRRRISIWRVKDMEDTGHCALVRLSVSTQIQSLRYPRPTVFLCKRHEKQTIGDLRQRTWFSDCARKKDWSSISIQIRSQLRNVSDGGSPAFPCRVAFGSAPIVATIRANSPLSLCQRTNGRRLLWISDRAAFRCSVRVERQTLSCHRQPSSPVRCWFTSGGTNHDAFFFVTPQVSEDIRL